MFGHSRKPLPKLAPACLLPLLLSCAPAPPQEVGVTGDGNLQAVLEGIRAEAELPALAGMLIVGDEIVEIAATGFRVMGDSTPVTVDDKWHIGSNTKAMTATLAGIFVERGLIEWSTTIEDVLPELRGQIRPEFLDVRLDELLSHTAGVSNNVGETPFWATSRETEAPLIEQRAVWVPQLLSLEPGAARGSFAYSNSGYVVAGAMLERLTGESWETLMRRELFQSLGMNGAGFGAPGDPEAMADQPRGHRGEGTSAIPVYADNPPALGPAGTVHVSLPEHAQFLVAHMKGAQGEDGIVSAATFEKLHTPFPESNYALGWGVAEREWARGSALTHNGSNTIWFHAVWVAPERNIAIVAAANIVGENAPGAVDRAVGAILARFEASEGSLTRSEGEPPPDDPAAEYGSPEGTSVFTCLQDEPVSFNFTITDLRMKPGELGLWLPLRFGRSYDLLREEGGAQGTRYSGNGVLLRSSGDVATLEVDGQTFEGCRLDRRESVWEHAKLTGVDFRATGNEPGWYIEIRDDSEAREGKRIRFVFDYGQRDAILHASNPEPEPGLRRTVYRGKNGDLRIVVEIEGNACSDSMSGEQFESTVTVEFQGRTYRGCGRALH
jgi:CubicO group peptidase (beta-lactamase class C family)/uncharacterized membrane protein